MDITLIAITFFLLIAIVFLLIFLFKGINKKTFTADDGSVFENQSDLDVYLKLYDKTKCLFTEEEDKTSSQKKLGLDQTFMNRLIKEGINDLKTLVKYRKQFKILSDLINS
tara:strand:+ start:1476 stop:1808 length:333 start_codon:yes stop_codon:yes gene_type:complete